MTAIMVAVAVGLWPACCWLGYKWGRRQFGGENGAGLSAEPLPPLPEQRTRFLVIHRSNGGARAREIFERGEPGPEETLEFWDNDVCRGRKGPAAKREA